MLTLLLTISILLLLFFSAYCSGSEAALFSLPTTQIQLYQSSANPRKRLVAQLLTKPRDLLVTIFILNTLVNILLQNNASSLFGESASWSLKVGIPLILTLIFGEVVPKYIGLQYNTSFSLRVAPAIVFFQRILAPAQRAAIAITAPISKILFFFLKKEPPISSEELQHILKTSENRGVFTAEEGEMIAGYLELQDSTVKELMRPREELLYYSLKEPLTKLIHLLVDEKCSRLPVCDPDLDSILGIITVKQFFLHKHNILNPKDLIPFLKKPLYVPETAFAWSLLRRMKEERQILALVVDEYGSVSGLITREDLIEIVIGEIADSRDEPSLYTRSGKNEIIASGKLELEEFNEFFKSHLSSPSNCLTIGGWLTEKLGEIPKNGSRYELDNFFFQILNATPNRIRRLYIRKIR